MSMTSAQATDLRALPDEPLALDLTNTEFLPDGTLVDLLATAESTRAWLTAAGLDRAASGNPGPTRATLRQARTAIRDALSGRGTARLNQVLGHGRVRLSVSADLVPLRTLDADDPAWQPAVMAAANLLDLLEQAPDRVKHCENPACMLWFFDTTRNGTRRWCSMAVCGNRMKARRHYDRVKTRLYRDAAGLPGTSRADRHPGHTEATPGNLTASGDQQRAAMLPTPDECEVKFSSRPHIREPHQICERPV
jgi:predicted RNA-binding Zn ribbon-like protein